VDTRLTTRLAAGLLATCAVLGPSCAQTDPVPDPATGEVGRTTPGPSATSPVVSPGDPSEPSGARRSDEIETEYDENEYDENEYDENEYDENEPDEHENDGDENEYDENEN